MGRVQTATFGKLAKNLTVRDRVAALDISKDTPMTTKSATSRDSGLGKNSAKYHRKQKYKNSGVARAFPGGRLAHPRGQNEEEISKV